MTTFLLVRHGTTNWVDAQLLHGITDIPLNDNGRAQAADAAKALKNCGATKMYTSPLSRCVETAATIGKSTGLKAIPTNDLIEINFGWLEGKKIRDHDRGEYSKFAEFIDDHFYNLIRSLSGESRRRFNKRISLSWPKFTHENPSGTVIIVAHSGVINAILRYYFGSQHLKKGERYHHLGPCSISELEIDDAGKAKLIRLNDNAHISEKKQ